MWFLKPHYFCKYSIAHKYALIFTSTKRGCSIVTNFTLYNWFQFTNSSFSGTVVVINCFPKIGTNWSHGDAGCISTCGSEKRRRREDRSCKRARVLTTSGNKAVFTASMQYGGTSENTLRETFLGESQWTAWSKKYLKTTSAISLSISW